MDEESDSLELSERQKIRLLSLALEPDRTVAPPDANEQKGDLLCDILRCPLPTQSPEQGASSAVVGKPSLAFRAVVGPRLVELLQDPKTDIAVLRGVKEYAKALGKDAGSDVQKDVFLTIYFAAIAAAIVLHEERITEHSDQDLRYFFGFFAKAAWMPITLAGLFAKAAQSVRTRA